MAHRPALRRNNRSVEDLISPVKGWPRFTIYDNAEDMNRLWEAKLRHRNDAKRERERAAEGKAA